MAGHVLGGRQGGHALGARWCSLVRPAGQGPADQVGDVVGATHVDESPRGWRTARTPRCGSLVVGGAPAQGFGDVVEGGDEVVDEFWPPRAGGVASDLADRGDDVVGEAVGGELERAAAAQPVEGELPDRLEQAVPRLGSARVDRHERGDGELVQEGVELGGPSTAATARALVAEKGPANTASASNSNAASGDSRS